MPEKNNKPDLFFNITIGIITFALGLYVFKNIIFLSVIFFLIAISAFILAYSAYKTQARLMNNLEAIIIPEDLKILSYSVFITANFFFLYLITN